MPALLRWQIFAAYGVTFLAVWYYALKTKNDKKAAEAAALPMTVMSNEKVDLLIDYGPLWAALALGVYAASSVVVGVINFRDCPEAAAELNKEIIEAKAEMKRRGIIKE